MKIPSRLSDEQLRRLLWDLNGCIDGSTAEERKSSWYRWLTGTTKEIENELTYRHCGPKIDEAIEKERRRPRFAQESMKLKKLGASMSAARRKRVSAHDWDGISYRRSNEQIGRAQVCVKYVACPHCKARVGQLCRGARGPHWNTHFVRRYAYHAYRCKRDGHVFPISKQRILDSYR